MDGDSVEAHSKPFSSLDPGDLLDHLDHKEHQGSRDKGENQASLVRPVTKVREDHQDHLELLVKTEIQVKTENRVFQV